MKAQDLRIGNWVIGSHSETPFKTEHHQVTGFDLYGNRNDYFQPIELTPELLEKCGFEEWSKGNWKLPEEMCINGWADEFNYYEPYKVLSTYTGNIDLLHLHQLQNLFHSLTGKEIEVNL